MFGCLHKGGSTIGNGSGKRNGLAERPGSLYGNSLAGVAADNLCPGSAGGKRPYNACATGHSIDGGCGSFIGTAQIALPDGDAQKRKSTGNGNLFRRLSICQPCTATIGRSYLNRLTIARC